MTTPTTKLAAILIERERSFAWLGRQMGLGRHAIADWVQGREACPKARRAQIYVTLGWHVPTQGVLFDRDGFAIPKED